MATRTPLSTPASPLGVVGRTPLSLSGAQPDDEGGAGGPLGIFTNAFRDLKDMVGGVAALAGSIGSDVVQAGQELFTGGKAEGDFVTDDIVNGITGGLLNVFGEEGWHPSESVLVQDYANRYGSLEKFGKGLWEHPLAFISDALMVATLGGTAAATAASTLGKVGTVGSKAAELAAQVGKVATVADELSFLKAGRILPEDLGTAAKFVAKVQGDALPYVDQVTGRLGYFDPVRNPVKRVLFQQPAVKLLMERGGSTASAAEKLALGALNGETDLSLLNQSIKVQKMLDLAMREGAPVMKRWASTYKAKKYIDFMYGSSKLRKTAIMREVDKGTKALLDDLPDGVTEVDVMNAAMGLDGSLVNDGYVPKSGRGLRRAEIFDAIGPETSGTGTVNPGVDVLDNDLVPTDASQLAPYIDPNEVMTDPNGPVVAEVNPQTGETRVVSGAETLRVAARNGQEVPVQIRHGRGVAEVDTELNDVFDYIDQRSGRITDEAGNDLPGTTFEPPAAADVSWDDETKLLREAIKDGRAQDLGDGVYRYTPKRTDAPQGPSAAAAHFGVPEGEDVFVHYVKPKGDMTAEQVADLIQEKGLKAYFDKAGTPGDTRKYVFAQKLEDGGAVPEGRVAIVFRAPTSRLKGKGTQGSAALSLEGDITPDRILARHGAGESVLPEEVASGPGDKVYVRTDDKGRVISYRDVDAAGKVNAATASDLQHGGNAFKLILAHWDDEGVRTAEDIKRVIGANTLSEGGLALNRKAARRILRGVDSPVQTASNGGKVLSAELRHTLSRGEPVSPKVRADMHEALVEEFGRGVVTAGDPKSVESAARKAALAGGMDAVDDAGPRFRVTTEVTDEALREGVRKAGDAVGGTLRRIENGVATPGSDGSRFLRAIYETDHGAVEVQFMSPLAKETMDATSNLRKHIEGLAAAIAGEKDPAMKAGLIVQLKKAEAYSQNLWEAVTAEMRAASGGFQDSVMRQKLHAMRLMLHKTMGDPAIEAGLPVDSLFDNPMLALRMRNGATWSDEVDDFIGGGMSTLDLDNELAQGGHMAPVYMPAIDARRLPKRGAFMMRNTSNSGLRLVEDANLRRNTGYLLEKSISSKTGKLKTKGSLVSTDIRRTMAVRARRAANNQVSRQLVRATLDQYSRKVADWTEKADDEVMWSPQLLNFIGNTKAGSDDVLMHALEQGLDEGTELSEWLKNVTLKNQKHVQQLLQSDGDMELRAIPKVVADRLEDYTKQVGGENLRVMWRNPTQMWKTLVLSGSPRWIMNNIVGNTIFLKLQGGKMSDVIRQLDGRWVKFLRKAVGMKEENQFKAALRELMPENARARVEGAGLYDAEYGKVAREYTDDTLAGRIAGRMQQSTKLNENPLARGMKTFSDFTHKLNEGIEEAYRRASYLRASDKVALRNGVLGVGNRFWTTKENLKAAFRNGLDEKTAGKLVDEVNHFLNDYNAMTPAGQNIIRPYLVPFWGFYRHATRMLLTMPFEHPGKAQLLRAFNASADNQREQLGMLPSWLEDALPLGPAGSGGDYRFLSTAGANPFNTVLESPLNLLHPYAKMLYEESTGRSTFTGKQFTDPNVYKAFGSDQQYRLDGQGNPIPVDKVAPGLIQEVLSQVPQYNMLSDILAGGATYDTATLLDILRGQGTIMDPETGQPVYPKGVLETLAKLMGYSTSTFNPAEFTEKRLAEMEAVLTQAAARNPELATGRTPLSA